jgi:hypothetical protein
VVARERSRELLGSLPLAMLTYRSAGNDKLKFIKIKFVIPGEPLRI